VPTPEQVNEWRALRGRFLNALWDAEHAGEDWPAVAGIFDRIGESSRPAHEKGRLVEDLVQDGLISGEMSLGGTYPPNSQLTSDGRYEVERWIAEPDRPTEHLPLPANTVFNIGTLQGPFVHSSPHATVTTTYHQHAQQLLDFAEQVRQVIESRNLSPEAREAAEADLDTVTEQAKAPQPEPRRLRPAVRRLLQAVGQGATTGAARSGIAATAGSSPPRSTASTRHLSSLRDGLARCRLLGRGNAIRPARRGKPRHERRGGTSRCPARAARTVSGPPTPRRSKQRPPRRWPGASCSSCPRHGTVERTVEDMGVAHAQGREAVRSGSARRSALSVVAPMVIGQEEMLGVAMADLVTMSVAKPRGWASTFARGRGQASSTVRLNPPPRTDEAAPVMQRRGGKTRTPARTSR